MEEENELRSCSSLSRRSLGSFDSSIYIARTLRTRSANQFHRKANARRRR